MAKNADDKRKLPPNLLWLADAPLFIDPAYIAGFYDAIVRPETQEGMTTLQISEQTTRQMSGRLGLEAGLSPSDLLQMLSVVLPFLKAEGKVSAEGVVQGDQSKQSARSIQLHPITTPQRQLIQLVLHYLINIPDRLFFVTDPSNETWRTRETIVQVPRALVFLDLPTREEARQQNVPETKIIPIAAEFSNGKTELLYDKLTSLNGRLAPPDFPEQDKDLTDFRKKRGKYWRWFDINFRPNQAMRIVEDMAAVNGRIEWIDYRIPLALDGSSLHLHICPSGKYNTGVFAYNFIRRGYKHGVRLIGTLRSGPDMNVLAIYDK